LRKFLHLLQKALAAQLDNGEPENEYVKKNVKCCHAVKYQNQTSKYQRSNIKYQIPH